MQSYQDKNDRTRWSSKIKHMNINPQSALVIKVTSSLHSSRQPVTSLLNLSPQNPQSPTFIIQSKTGKQPKIRAEQPAQLWHHWNHSAPAKVLQVEMLCPVASRNLGGETGGAKHPIKSTIYVSYVWMYIYIHLFFFMQIWCCNSWNDDIIQIKIIIMYHYVYYMLHHEDDVYGRYLLSNA